MAKCSPREGKGLSLQVLISLYFLIYAFLFITFSQKFVPSSHSRGLPFLTNFGYFCLLPISFALTKSSKNDYTFNSKAKSNLVRIPKWPGLTATYQSCWEVILNGTWGYRTGHLNIFYWNKSQINLDKMAVLIFLSVFGFSPLPCILLLNA